jgi:hypothetical protein
VIPRFSTFLAELFEKPYAVREMKRLGYGIATAEITYQAKTEDGKYLNIDITKINHGWEINFTIDGSHDLTHAGKPFRVFATVIEAARMFLEWHLKDWDALPQQLNMISKTSESKREVVYAALMRRFGKQYGYRITNRSVVGSGGPDNQRTVVTATLSS